MTDVVVTVPKTFEYERKVGLAAWISEGDAAGDPWSGQEWAFTTWGGRPTIEPGERVYVVCNAKLRGYAPLIRVERDAGAIIFIRGGGAVAVTIDTPIQGFRGWRYRWWERTDERAFPDWQTP